MDIKEYVRQVEARRVVTQPKIHKVCCTNCPSANYPSDPETEDILTWPREQQKETVFACGWNQKRYCKGYCDVLKITEQEIIEIHTRRLNNASNT